MLIVNAHHMLTLKKKFLFKEEIVFFCRSLILENSMDTQYCWWWGKI